MNITFSSHFSPNSLLQVGGWGFADFVDSLRGALSHGVSLEVSFGACRGPGWQTQDRAVTQGVVGGVIFWCVQIQGRAIVKQGVIEAVIYLMRVRARVQQHYFLYKFLFLFGYILYLYFGVFLAQKYIYGRRCILWIGLKQIAENRWYLSILFGVYAGIIDASQLSVCWVSDPGVLPGDSWCTEVPFWKLRHQVSSDQNSGWLDHKGLYILPMLYGDYIRPLQGSLSTNQYAGMLWNGHDFAELRWQVSAFGPEPNPTRCWPFWSPGLCVLDELQNEPMCSWHLIQILWSLVFHFSFALTYRIVVCI